MKIEYCSLPHSPMEYSKKNPGEGWRRERKKTRAALKDEKTYIHVPLMKKKSTKVTKAGKEELSLRDNTERRDAEPDSSPIKIIEAVDKSQARTLLLPAKVNRSKMLVMSIQIKVYLMFIFLIFPVSFRYCSTFFSTTLHHTVMSLQRGETLYFLVATRDMFIIDLTIQYAGSPDQGGRRWGCPGC